MMLAMQAAPEPPVPTLVAPLTVSPAKAPPRPDVTIDAPYDRAKGHWASVWPEGAYRNGVSGVAVLACDIDRFGLAEACKLISETPSGEGFGPAALQLRPTFKVTPAQGPNGPVDTVMTIAVSFNPPPPEIDVGGAHGGGPAATNVGPLSNGGGADSPRVGGPLPGQDRRSISMLNNPVWAATASYGDLMGAYPAQGEGSEGYTVIHCQVRGDGALAACEVVREDPESHGFGKAALSLSARFRVAPQWTSAPHHAEVWLDLPIRFPAPGDMAQRVAARPYWLAGPARVEPVFPQAARDKGVKSGLGRVECHVSRDGSLTGCAPAAAEPEGLGFSEAAAAMASTMRMNPWLRDGEPADGAVVRLAIRISLPPTP